MTNSSERKWRIEESKKLGFKTRLELMIHWGISKRTAGEYLVVMNGEQ